jgi:hypothetical protein|tara:strand:- start:1638 stop:2570 length:933 start_codon:yes stop_codon:yes gene_type:complete
MATSVYFSGAVKSEQDLYEDLVIESIKIFGQDVVYLPREQIAEDTLLNETWNQYTQAFPIEMWLEDTEGFGGDSNLLGKFGLEIRDQGTFVVTKRRWEQVVGGVATGAASRLKPAEGDLLYMTLTKRLFEIKYVEPKSPFYQLKDLPTYTLTAELFEYNDQHFDTGWDEIDQVEWDNATSYSYLMSAGTDYKLGEKVTQWTGVNDSDGDPINVQGYVAGWESDNDINRVTIISPHQSTNGDGTFKTFFVDADANQALVGTESGTTSNIVTDESGTVKTFYNKDVFADNDEFELAGDDVIDFTESNPFGDP